MTGLSEATKPLDICFNCEEEADIWVHERDSNGKVISWICVECLELAEQPPGLDEEMKRLMGEV